MRWLIVHPGPNFSVLMLPTAGLKPSANLVSRSPYSILTIGSPSTTACSWTPASLNDEGQPARPQSLHPRPGHRPRILRAPVRLLPALARRRPRRLRVLHPVAAPRQSSAPAPQTRPPGHTECPYQDDEQLERAAHADLNLLNDPVSLDGVPGARRPRRVRAARLPAVRAQSRPGSILDRQRPGVRRHRVHVPHRVLRADGTGRPGRAARRELAAPERPGLAAAQVPVAHDIDECLDNEPTVPDLPTRRRPASTSTAAKPWRVTPRTGWRAGRGRSRWPRGPVVPP